MPERWPVCGMPRDCWHLSIHVYLAGRRWQRDWNVQTIPIAVFAPESARYHQAGRSVRVYDPIEDVRELVLEWIRPDAPAMWSDVVERLGLDARHDT